MVGVGSTAEKGVSGHVCQLEAPTRDLAAFREGRVNNMKKLLSTPPHTQPCKRNLQHLDVLDGKRLPVCDTVEIENHTSWERPLKKMSSGSDSLE
jgi:hypothetical protein